MADDDLSALRAKRIAQMKAKQAQGGPPPGEMEQQKAKAEAQRDMVLRQILLPNAKERLSRIALVKPERARIAEEILLKAAMSGQIQEKVDESYLKGILEKITEQESKTTITMKRRTLFDDEDDDDLFDDL